MIAFATMLQTVEAGATEDVNFKCTAYCGTASRDTLGYKPKRKCLKYDTWGEQCGGESIEEINFKKVIRFDVFSETVTGKSIEEAYTTFVNLCRKTVDKQNYYSGQGFIFRRFDNDRNAVLPDIDDALKTCVVESRN